MRTVCFLISRVVYETCTTHRSEGRVYTKSDIGIQYYWTAPLMS